MSKNSTIKNECSPREIKRKRPMKKRSEQICGLVIFHSFISVSSLWFNSGLFFLFFFFKKNTWGDYGELGVFICRSDSRQTFLLVGGSPCKLWLTFDFSTLFIHQRNWTANNTNRPLWPLVVFDVQGIVWSSHRVLEKAQIAGPKNFFACGVKLFRGEALES